MSEQGREPYPIQWNAPTGGTAQPAWAGPRPDAETAPTPSPRADGAAGTDDVHGVEAANVAASAGPAAAPPAAPEPVNSAAPTTNQGNAAAAPTQDDAPAPAPRPDASARSGATPVGSGHAAPAAPAASPQPSAPQQSGEPGPSIPAPRPEAPAERPAAQPQPAAQAHPAGGYASAPPQVVGQHDDLPEDSLTIGRSRSNSIVLDDMLVSRRHVVITADDEGLLLRDLGSRNGTFVNGRRVEQTHLHEGDRIGIGASTFEVRDGWLVSV